MSDEVKPEEPTYSNFISAAMEFLAARPNANILVLVESAGRMETFRNVVSPIWNLGALSAANMQFMNMLAAMKQATQEKSDTIESEEQERIEQSVKRDKGRTN